jgi:hypothetical protein
MEDTISRVGSEKTKAALHEKTAGEEIHAEATSAGRSAILGENVSHRLAEFKLRSIAGTIFVSLWSKLCSHACR